MKKTLTVTAAGAALLLSAAAFADPPRWAPANGWRAQHSDHRHAAPLGYDRYDRRRGDRHASRTPVVIHHYAAPRVRHVYAPPREVVVYHQPAYVVPAPAVAAGPFGWSVDLRFGGDWR